MPLLFVFQLAFAFALLLLFPFVGMVVVAALLDLFPSGETQVGVDVPIATAVVLAPPPPPYSASVVSSDGIGERFS